MALFSQREGIRPTEKAIQKDSMDGELRSCLWSGLTFGLWNRWTDRCNYKHAYEPEYSKLVECVVNDLWVDHFKLAIDTRPPFNRGDPKGAHGIIRERFFHGEWWQCYDMIEFLIKVIPEEWKDGLKESLNRYMASENAAYRIVGSQIVEIADEQEIESIETALDKGITTIRLHLSRALALLSDRKQPDFRNSIKESISAVEAACQVLSGKPKATLGDCVRAFKGKGAIHPALELALLKLYGYTSDEGGIRHALTDESIAPAYSDAKFMLVASSAFVNFLWTKVSELGLKIET